MLVLHDRDTLKHRTVELIGAKLIAALESPERITAILETLSNSHHEVHTISYRYSPVDDRDQLHALIAATHSSDYLTHLKEVFSTWLTASLIGPKDSILPECFPFPGLDGTNPSQPPKDIYARTGYFAFDMSTGITSDTYLSALASANLASCATTLLFPTSSNPTPANTALALTRPPGHHCDGSRCGGYCYINNAAVAISSYRSSAQSAGAKIAILDIDFHHGNGTQSLFHSDPNVLYVSIHGEDEFPYYTGHESENTDSNLNLPLPSGSSFESYMQKLQIGLDKIKQWQPEFLVVSLGFDTFYMDPLGKFEIEEQHYWIMASVTRKELEGIEKSVILLEGGYVVDRLGACLMSFLKGWEGNR